MPSHDRLPAPELLFENGRIVRDATGSAIRDFPFLPRYISIRAPGWLLEFWARTDRRLTYRDVKARMQVPADQLPADNLLNVRRDREARGPLGLSCWFSRHGEIARVEVERVERWSLNQIYFNTTMVVEYSETASGKSIPIRLRAKMLEDGTPRYYPLRTFLDQKHIWVPSPRIQDSISLLWRLAQRAEELGLRSWQVLPKEELPASWKVVLVPKRFTYFNTKDFDDGVYPKHGRYNKIVPRATNANGARAEESEILEKEESIIEEDIPQPEQSGSTSDTEMKDAKEDSPDEDMPLILRRHHALKAARERANARAIENESGHHPNVPIKAGGDASSDEDMPLILRRHPALRLQMERKRAYSVDG